MLCYWCVFLFFFFKQKTAYEVRISDWSSDVCSSDLAGFLVFAPALAIGLYDKSRALERGEPVSLRHMLLPHARAGGQVLFIGALLCGVMLLWMRAAVIIYALFFGVRPFPGIDHISSEEHTSELQSLMRISYAVFRLKKK